MEELAYMFTFQVYEKAFPLEGNLDDVAPTCEKMQFVEALENYRNMPSN